MSNSRFSVPVRIIGAGLSGVALADALLKRGISCILVDQTGIASGASGAASGLLHPLPGLRAIPGWRAWDAFRLARLSVEHRAQVDPLVIGAQGVFRPVTESQRADFTHAAQEGWADWCRAGPPCEIPHSLAREGLWIAEGCVVDVPRYLNTWVEELKLLGLQTAFGQYEGKKTELHAPEQLTVWCTGMHAAELLPVPCTVVRGQALTIRPMKVHPQRKLACGVAGRAYIAPYADYWVVGATFEHHELSSAPDLEKARQGLSKRVEELWPNGALLDQPIQSVHVGHRLSTPDHYPICGRLEVGDWIMAGLGSKGLLYHVLVAQELANAIETGCPEEIPMEISLLRWNCR